jgi:2-amino-4-hydroxy-6-hydroxymethyldihydropteridine diphosphokinase
MPLHHDAARERPLTVIGLGANLGDRLGAIERAIRAIEALPDTEVVGRSSVWRTLPVGGPPAPDYYNAAVGIRSGLPAHDLMRALLAIESHLGRVRGERNDPRTLDLDILWIDGQIIAPPPARDATSDALGLEVPHPRLRERAFALIPMLEVVGDAVDPQTGRLYAEILAEIGTEGVAPLDSTHA